MKRLFVILAAAMLIVGVAGQAMASFEAGNLVLVTYEGDHDVVSSGNEAFYDLGSMDLSGLPSSGTTIDTGITLVDFDTTVWSDIKIGLVGGSVNAGYQPTDPIFFTSDATTDNYVGVTSPFASAYTALVGDSDEIGYGDTVVGNKATMAKDSYGSYSTFFNAGANPGYYALSVNGGYGNFGAETQLGDGIYETYLYTSNANSLPTLLGTLTLDTTSGSLVVGYSQVPVPGALILLSSSLLAMVGLRRKNS